MRELLVKGRAGQGQIFEGGKRGNKRCGEKLGKKGRVFEQGGKVKKESSTLFPLHKRLEENSRRIPSGVTVKKKKEGTK